jgi:HEAT repeat protein
MTEASVKALLESLRGARRDKIEEGVRELARRLPGLSDADLRAGVEAMCALFFIDPHDRPDLEPVLDQVVEAIAGGGERVVPALIEAMEGSDLKSHVHLARTLSRIGRPALGSLRVLAASAPDPYTRAFALYAIGKVRDPAVRDALPEALAGLAHREKEVRDSAARALGKVADHVPVDQLSTEARTSIFEGLARILSDTVAPVRAKAVRSLGKLVRAGYLQPDQERLVQEIALRLLGRDEHFEWDRAYIVRIEAEEVLGHVESRRSGAPRP